MSVTPATFNRLAALAAMVSTAAVSGALAQDYPAKPIRIVVEYAAGAGGDVFLRQLGPHMASALGQPIVFENRAGGGGLVAAESVARAAPDGYTVLAASQNALIVRPYLAKGQQKLDVFRDLAPVTNVWNSTTLILSHQSLPVTSLAELIAYAKANPGKISYGTSGFGTSHHFSGEEIQQLTGIRMVHVPYKGGTGSMQAVMTGEVPVAIGLAGTAVPPMKSGKVRVLAMVEGKRFMNMSSIPQVSELVKGFEPPPSWTGLFVPSKTPRPVLQRLSEQAIKGLKSPGAPEVEGFEVAASTAEEFAAQLKSQFNLIGRLVKAANIKPVD